MNKSSVVYWSSGTSLEREENKDGGGEEEEGERATLNIWNTVHKVTWF